MNKRGFTLIEMIGTILILSLIMIIIVPSVSKNIKKSTKKADEQTKESIILAAKNYLSDNKKETCVEVKTLIDNGYLESGKEIQGKVTKNDHNFKYENGTCN